MQKNVNCNVTHFASGGQDQVSYAKDDIWTYDAVNKVWVTTTLTLGAPIYLHAVTVIESCPTSAGAWIRQDNFIIRMNSKF